MMSLQDTTKDNHGDAREALSPILRVLSQLGGHFTFTDDRQGEQFVIMSKRDFDAFRESAVQKESEKQLPLPPRPVSLWRVPEPESADQVLENINRDIALYQIKQQEENITDELLSELTDQETPVVVTEFIENNSQPLPPPVRVRFEPIRGDLPPDLQE